MPLGRDSVVDREAFFNRGGGSSGMFDAPAPAGSTSASRMPAGIFRPSWPLRHAGSDSRTPQPQRHRLGTVPKSPNRWVPEQSRGRGDAILTKASRGGCRYVSELVVNHRWVPGTSSR